MTERTFAQVRFERARDRVLADAGRGDDREDMLMFRELLLAGYGYAESLGVTSVEDFEELTGIEITEVPEDEPAPG